MKTRLAGRHGMLYPMLVIAAVSAIVVSVFGVATVTGIFPPVSNTAQSSQ
jgi:hypothetical protein